MAEGIALGQLASVFLTNIRRRFTSRLVNHIMCSGRSEARRLNPQGRQCQEHEGKGTFDTIHSDLTTNGVAERCRSDSLGRRRHSLSPLYQVLVRPYTLRHGLKAGACAVQQALWGLR